MRRELLLDLADLPDRTTKSEDNTWYAAIAATTRRVTTEICYVCAQPPYIVGATLPIKPSPLTVSETLGVMVAFTLGVSLQNNGHKIDEVAMELETLTALVETGFSTLSPTIQGPAG